MRGLHTQFKGSGTSATAWNIRKDGGVFRKCLGPALAAILALFFFSSAVLAQSLEGVLRGQITDPSGAAISAATVTVTDSQGATKQVQTNEQGQYVLQGLPAGTYTIKVQAIGFVDFEKGSIVIAPGSPQVVDAKLQVAMEKQEITVNDTTNRLSVSQENNASAVVIKGKDLGAFSDDPEDLQADLQALAGPAAGPNGGQIYIDGFSGGQLPPKSDILEVRVNQNPFSAEYDTLGYGRIEVTTKPGSSKLHGQLFADGSNSDFNSRNPFVTKQPPYHLAYEDANVGGPLGKKASFFLYGFRRDMQDSSIVNAIVLDLLDPAFAPIPFSQAVLDPQARTYLGPRVDFQLSPSHVLSVRYQFWHESKNKIGIGQFSLPSQAYDTRKTEHIFEISDTQVLSPRILNQTKFQSKYGRENDTPESLLPAVVVLGAFTGGGNSLGKNLITQNTYQLQNLTSISVGKHALALGGRLRDVDEVDYATRGYNGAFTFSSINTYLTAEQALEQCNAAGGSACAVSGASQFTITAGNPIAQLNLFDLGLFGEDQWRARPNLSLSLGLRVEAQNHIHDHADIAPRVGLAWGLGGAGNPRTVLRAGAGVFYDRFQEAQVLQAERLDGVNEQEFVVSSPCFFPNVPSPSELSTLNCGQSVPTKYHIDSHLQAPRTRQAAIGIEQQISQHATASVTYLNSHGVHQLLTRNINTPLPGTYPLDPVYPFGNAGNIFQYESDGLFNQNQIITNFNIRMGTKYSIFGYYTLSFANSNTAGPDSFPMNPYDVLADYGRAAFDVRHRLFMGGSVGLPRGFSLSPLVIANSGAPFNITLGQDLLGTSIFNARPALAPPGATGPGIVATPFGTFDTLPAPDESVIPPYYGAGPGQFTLNLRLSKTLTFGNKGARSQGTGGWWWPSRKGKGLGERGLSAGEAGSSGAGSSESRYSLQLSLAARNIFNFVNLGTPVGNLTSRIFGRSNSLAPSPFSSLSAPRRLDFQARFTF